MAKMKCETCGCLVVDGPADHQFYDGPTQTFEEHLRGCPAPSLTLSIPGAEVFRE